MPLSNRVLKESNQASSVLEFQLPKIDMGVPSQAVESLESRKKNKSDFNFSEATRNLTGMNKIEELSIQEEIEKRVLSKLEEIQKAAYLEAYQLGLIEGKKEAFATASADIQQKLKELDGLTDNLKMLKPDLLKQNETHLIRLMLEVASRISLKEVQLDNDIIMKLIRVAVEESQSEEKITIHVSLPQLGFLEELQKSPEYDLEFLKRIKFVPDEAIQPGGCIVETNYGEVDARNEVRIQKLWAAFEEALNPIKVRTGAA